MKSTDKLMDMLCTELDEIAEKGQLSAGDLDTVHKLIVSKEKLLRCEELEGNLGYSNDGGWRAEGMYSKRNSYDNGNSYSDYSGGGYSGAGRHYVRGHYSRDRGRSRYSMAEGSEMMTQSMQDMINDPSITEQERNALRRAMEVLNR